MHRPLRVPFYVRVWHLVKGLLFYNTWNWEKASDGLNMPTLSREERERRRPKADLEIIKPRERPRARIDLRQKSKLPEGNYRAQVSEPLPESSGGRAEAEYNGPVQPSLPPPRPEGEYIKRRKYKRRRTNGATGGNSFFRRVFGKE